MLLKLMESCGETGRRFDPSPMIPYMKSLGIPYFFESQNLLDDAKTSNPRSICAWCSRMKRGILYSCARREGYNKLVLAQHLDDLAESMLMSAFHNGRLRTMKANYMNKVNDLGRASSCYVLYEVNYIGLVSLASSIPAHHESQLHEHGNAGL